MRSEKPLTKKSFEIKRKKSLVYSKVNGAFDSIMSGFGENYIAPFAIFLKATAPQVALLTSVANLTSSISQFFSVRLHRFLDSRKRIVLYSVFFHSIMWLIILAASYITRSPLVLLFLYGLYFFIGSLPAPSWTSWMGDLVPKEERGKYFGSRNKITGFFGFISVLFAGLILSRISNINTFLGFAVLFVIAFLARFISLLFLRKQYDPPHTIKTEESIGFKNFFKDLKKSNFGLFSSYISILHLTTNIAGPFFAVFMLRDLQITYSQYAIITGAATISTFLTMSYWGRVSDAFGNKKILEVTGFLVAVIPLLWLVNNNFFYLVTINLFAGFAWAGFNLSSSNFIFDSTNPKTRAESVSYFNLFRGLAVVIGASIGSLLVLYLPSLPFTKYSLLTLFLISGIGRLLTSLYFLPKIHEVRITEYKPRNLFRLITIGPIEGIIYEGISGLNKTIVKLKNGLSIIEKETKKVERKINPKVETDYKKAK